MRSCDSPGSPDTHRSNAAADLCHAGDLTHAAAAPQIGATGAASSRALYYRRRGSPSPSCTRHSRRCFA